MDEERLTELIADLGPLFETVDIDDAPSERTYRLSFEDDVEVYAVRDESGDFLQLSTDVAELDNPPELDLCRLLLTANSLTEDNDGCWFGIQGNVVTMHFLASTHNETPQSLHAVFAWFVARRERCRAVILSEPNPQVSDINPAVGGLRV